MDVQAFLSPSLSLEDLYLAVLIGSRLLSVRLRPELKGTESLHVMREVDEALARGALQDPAELFQLRRLGSQPPPQALLRGIVTTITDRYYELGSLALAMVRGRRNLEARLLELRPLPGLAASDDERLALARLWIGQCSICAVLTGSFKDHSPAAARPPHASSA